MQMYSVHTMPYLRAKTVLCTIYAYSGASFLTLLPPPPKANKYNLYTIRSGFDVCMVARQLCGLFLRCCSIV